MAISKGKLDNLKQKGRAILRAQSETDTKAQPIDPENYTLSLMRALNYYSLEVDDKKKRVWAIAYFKKLGKNVTELSSVPDCYFSTIGAIAHLALNDRPLHDHDLIRLDIAYEQLLTFVPKVEEEAKEKKPTIQDHIANKASEVIGEFEGAIDDFMKNGTEFSPKANMNGLKPPVIKKIETWFVSRLPELKEAYEGKDKDLNEGYSNLGKRGLKKLIAFIEQIVSDCSISTVIAKAPRKPRTKKVKPPSVIAKNMKPMSRFEELGLTSVLAEKVVGANQVIAYNTKYRKLFVFVAADGLECTVKGSKIVNWDPEKSFGKTLRKPVEQLKGCSTWGKRAWSQLMSSIKGANAKPNGRITGDWVLINTF